VGDLTISKITELMREEDLVVDGDAKSADWKGLIRECETALTERTKDLELAGFLTLGWVHTTGFVGLLDGLVVIKSFINDFWDKLHPGYDQEDDEIILGIRARPISWIGSSDQFLMHVKQIPVTSSVAGMRPLTWLDYEETERVDNAQRMSDQTLFNELREQGKKTSEEWLSSMSATTPEARSEILNSIQACENEISELNQICDEKFEGDPPNLIKIESLLSDIKEYMSKGIDMTSDSSGAEGDGAIDSSENYNSAAAQNAGAQAQPAKSGVPGRIFTREDAIKCLREVAGFLRRSEPLNPISFLVERAARWGDMTFEEVMKEIVKNEDGLSQVWETLGITPPSMDYEEEES